MWEKRIELVWWWWFLVGNRWRQISAPTGPRWRRRRRRIRGSTLWPPLCPFTPASFTTSRTITTTSSSSSSSSSSNNSSSSSNNSNSNDSNNNSNHFNSTSHSHNSSRCSSSSSSSSSSKGSSSSKLRRSILVTGWLITLISFLSESSRFCFTPLWFSYETGFFCLFFFLFHLLQCLIFLWIMFFSVF